MTTAGRRDEDAAAVDNDDELDVARLPRTSSLSASPRHGFDPSLPRRERHQALGEHPIGPPSSFPMLDTGLRALLILVFPWPPKLRWHVEGAALTCP